MMTTGENFETSGDVIESQKQWLRENSVATIAPDYALEVYEYLKQLCETECGDIQLRMLIRGCSANLARQYPDKFCFDFLDKQKSIVLERVQQGHFREPFESLQNSMVQQDCIQKKAEVKCPACGYLSHVEANFCSKCGEPVFDGQTVQERITGYCSKCHCSLRISDHFCPKCGALGNVKPAGLIKRFCSIFIDALVFSFLLPFSIYVLMWLSLLFFGFGNPMIFGNNRSLIFPFLTILGVVFFLSAMYYMVLEKTFKIGSFGKKLLGLSLISTKGKNLSFQNLLLRHIVRIFELLLVFMGASFNTAILSSLLGKVVPLYPHELRYIVVGIYLIIMVLFISYLLREKKFFHDSWSGTMVIEG